MRTLLLALSLCISPWAPSEDIHESAPFEVQEAADMVADYRGGGLLDLGIKDQSGGTLYLDLVQLRQFFDHQKHKDLMVIVMAKQAWPEKKLREEIELLKGYFIKRGYRRIVIQQATGGGNFPTHLDHRVTPRNSDR